LQVHRILLGNKTDLPDQRQVQPEQGETVAKEFGIGWFETSAKDGSNVETGKQEIKRPEYWLDGLG
jgi:GTPase SAR1 family protein